MSNQAVLPRRSRRLATIIPASHWISIGYSNQEAQQMENLQNNIKKYCEDNEDNTEIDLRGRMEPGAVLPHHDMMIPHWQKLFKALRGHGKVNMIKIFGISLPVSVLDIIFNQSSNIEYFALLNVGLGNEGLLRLSSFVREKSSVKSLCIGGVGVRIDDMSVASSLSDAVKDHPTLEKLVLVACLHFEHHTDIIGKILEGCKGLDGITIAKCNVGSDDVNLLADFICSNHPTKIIQLDGNNILDRDTLVLAAALKRNTNLRQIDLRRNVITEAGGKALLKAMYDPRSMDSIVESNHTCMAFTFDITDQSVVALRPPIETGVLEINEMDISIGQKIRKKVILVLCGVDGSLFDLSHLNDISLQLMPRVLELIQEHTQIRTRRCDENQLEKDALSRLFHTLRGWELPLLFENLSPNKGAARKRKRKATRR